MKLAILAALLAFGAQAPAQANSSVIFGQDAFGNALVIPAPLCVAPGQALRLTADVLDFAGRRGFFPAQAFVWRYTRSNGFWEQWNAAVSPGFGPFRHGADVLNSVYVQIPFDTGPNGRIEVVGRGAMATWIQVVDPNTAYASTYCQWGPSQIYVGGPVPAPVPPAHIYPCYGTCAVGARCSDGCPPGAACSYTPGGVPFWLVLSCG